MPPSSEPLDALPLTDRVGQAPADYLSAVADRVRALLGAELVGVWLTGSAALGDFAAQRSDLDVQAISTGVLALDLRRRLADALSHPTFACPVRGLEFVLYAQDDLVAPGGPAFQLNLNTGPGMDQHVAFDAAHDPRFWFTIDVSIARRHAVPLAGAPGAAGFPELPRRIVLDALRDALSWYANEGGSPAQTVLSACRTWAWVTDGRWRSKAESASWACRQLRNPTPVEKAIRLRDGAAVVPPSKAEVDDVVDIARQALEGARAG